MAASAETKGSVYSCNICNKPFELHSMYACYHGHYLCRKCYKQTFQGKEKRCPHRTCNAFLVSEVNKGEPMERSKMMFPNPSVFSQQYVGMIPQNSLISIASLYKPSLLSIGASSKKPVQCPYHGCNKTIAVSSLDSHFEHEHKHVASIITQLETRNGLEFYFKDLHGKIKTLCLVLINIVEDKTDDMGESSAMLPILEEEEMNAQRSIYSKSSMPIPKPFFIVMAAKVTARDYNDDDEEEELPDMGFSPIDRIIFFVTSNIATTYSYTIAISTPELGIRVKYYGPLLTMKEDYKKLYDEGKGLILNHNHVDGMSEYGTRNVCLDVIVHDRGDDTYDSD